MLGNFLKAAILSVPGARKNSMFGYNPPSYVLGLVRRGQPLSLVNAIETLNNHYGNIKATYGLSPFEINIPEKTLNEFCEEILEQCLS